MTSEGLGEMFEGDSADIDWSELWRWKANIVTTIFVDGRQKVVTTINFFLKKTKSA